MSLQIPKISTTFRRPSTVKSKKNKEDFTIFWEYQKMMFDIDEE